MSGDPLTHPQAAAAFTARHAYISNFRRGVSLVQTWDGKNKGKPLCRASVHDDYGVSFHQCPLPGKTQTADGLWWCRVHEPAAVDRRDAARAAKYEAHQAKWRASYSAEQERQRRADAFERFLSALRRIEAGDNDPRATAREALGDFLESTNA